MLENTNHVPKEQFIKTTAPHLELRQEPQGSAPDFLEAGSDSDRRVPVECSGVSGLVFCGGMELRLHLKLFKDNTTFRDVCGTCGESLGLQGDPTSPF